MMNKTEAVLANYDFHLYGEKDHTLTLTAYPITWGYTVDGNLGPETLHGEGQDLNLEYPRDLKAIEFLLDDLAVNAYPFTGIDTWLDPEAIERGTDTPEAIREWLTVIEFGNHNLFCWAGYWALRESHRPAYICECGLSKLEGNKN
jgi:hypothetical protein